MVGKSVCFFSSVGVSHPEQDTTIVRSIGYVPPPQVVGSRLLVFEVCYEIRDARQPAIVRLGVWLNGWCE